MTHDFFSKQMDRLTGLKFVPADLTTHWEALRDEEPHLLEQAVSRSQRSRVEFPTPKELRADIALIKRDQPVPREVDKSAPVAVSRTFSGPEGITVRVTREWHYDCDDCRDAGWRSFWCGDDAQRQQWKPALVNRRCGATTHDDAYCHTWTEPCVCVNTNPTIQRRFDARLSHAQQAAGKGRA